MSRVIVVGSVNRDRVVRCAALPRPGETVVARSAVEGFGGKGGNQACAAARLGARVALVAAVGADPVGRAAIADLQHHGVDVSRVIVAKGVVTGRADVFVDTDGENFIVLESGANTGLGAGEVTEALRDLGLSPGDVVLTSNGIGAEALGATAEQGRAGGATHLHNLTPFGSLEPWSHGDHVVLIANAVEAHQATAMEDPTAAAVRLAVGRRAAVVTLGAQGALIAVGPDVQTVSAPVITAVDSTGAGDAFCGALAAALAFGEDEQSAVERAVRAGAFAVTGWGARGALATAADLA